MSSKNVSTRRRFLQQSAAVATGALAAPYFVPAASLGMGGAVAPSERLVMGCIGVGGKGRNNMGTFLNNEDVQVVAVCDVDQNHVKMAKEMVKQKYGKDECDAYKDFRELVERKDIDVVSVATPDHWHALPTIAALKNGKDVYCEKPLANSVAEGRAICDAAAKHDRIVQTGSHERSGANARFACELVRNGRIGKLHTIRINLPCDQDHHRKARSYLSTPPAQPIPSGFDYDMWLGHTPKAPYHPLRCHFWWRFNLAYGGGEMTDRGAHVIDLAQLGAGFDDTGPVEIVAEGVARRESLYNAFWDFSFENRFANGVWMVGRSSGPRGVRFEGTEGSVFIHVHGAKLEAQPTSLLDEKPDQFEIQLGRSPGHHRNFLDCVKSRQQPMASAEVGQRTGTICHLNNIAMLTGRKLQWDPQAEQVTNDFAANNLLSPKMRHPWSI